MNFVGVSISLGDFHCFLLFFKITFNIIADCDEDDDCPLEKPACTDYGLCVGKAKQLKTFNKLMYWLLFAILYIN